MVCPLKLVAKITSNCTWMLEMVIIPRIAVNNCHSLVAHDFVCEKEKSQVKLTKLPSVSSVRNVGTCFKVTI